MEQNLKISYMKPDKQGVFTNGNGYLFATETESDKECGVVLYSSCGKELRIPFSAEGKQGTLSGLCIECTNETFPFTKYNYYQGDSIYTDPYARLIDGLQLWGDFENAPRKTYGILTDMNFDWENDTAPDIPLQESVIYGLNVRAFTMHKSSFVKCKGTFEGIVEKIPHLQKLGITAVELMPAYEYEECMPSEASVQTKADRDMRVNCWGFQKGFYFSPKSSYSLQRADISFKSMVKALHRNGIEIWMHFYFTPDCNPVYITDILRFWSKEYHVDGFRLSGFHIPHGFIANDAVLKHRKIRLDYFPVDEVYQKPPKSRNLISENGNFKNDMRRILKGDENLISDFIHYQKNNSEYCGIVNSITDYDGFSLYDLVSYENKHNEANGENNRDGADVNYSWNCGAEGESRKKSITELRQKQIKNALSFLFLSQGIPYIFSGDELGNTRYGNNNVYCRDDDAGYVKWKPNRFSEDILNFVCEISNIRKKYSLLQGNKILKGQVSCAFGYPDISYHGPEAWRPDLSYISRMIGIMLCGENTGTNDTDFIYIAYNMHWENHELALPKLPKGKEWYLVLSTAEKQMTDVINDNKIPVTGRSVMLYASQNTKSPSKNKLKRDKK